MEIQLRDIDTDSLVLSANYPLMYFNQSGSVVSASICHLILVIVFLNLERMQEAVLAPGAVPNHIIMDENMADFLIIGGGIAGNLLANRIHNSLSCLSMDVNFGQFFNDRKISKNLKILNSNAESLVSLCDSCGMSHALINLNAQVTL